MRKTILITGATDGIGLNTAKRLAQLGHRVLLHGRSEAKLRQAQADIQQTSNDESVQGYLADLSHLSQAERLAGDVVSDHPSIDVLINNAGVFAVNEPRTDDGLDVRFAVNTIAPYILAKRLIPALGSDGRIVNVSSAAQAPVNLSALSGTGTLSDGDAYAQSKLALIMWTNQMAASLGNDGPMMVSVNPGSLLASKMVKRAFGIDGKDLSIGSDILVRAATSNEFDKASGRYYDNDSRRFGQPHHDALNVDKSAAVVQTMDAILSEVLAASR
ncbi:SDR family NAD(P)-dependent oxidoreductase [Crateriforma conspicua]|uniref:Putative ketoacyl reductase n=1 Tax=Crateriforma conspicua TaxID=2527996 RepID=A0A5C5XZH8_9PLAN|nr:SDR family NAD(P)-dependent oxidoreductase [Crateriforma conspicua]QDV62421.1 Putative ketoacyl reductase [Crateriforma conspicua]TWT68797.1 putative ketoacyl reductase [Crateriforma conspicua]